MKFAYITFALLLFITAKSVGQTKLKVGSITAGTTTFQINELKGALMEVNNKTNPNNDENSTKNAVHLSKIVFSDEHSVITAFSSVFNRNRLKELLPEINTLMIYHVNHQGKISYVTFFLKKNTLISAQELESLEKQLKSHVTFAIPKGEDHSDIIAPITQVVFFKNVLDKTAVN